MPTELEELSKNSSRAVQGEEPEEASVPESSSANLTQRRSRGRSPASILPSSSPSRGLKHPLVGGSKPSSPVTHLPNTNGGLFGGGGGEGVTRHQIAPGKAGSPGSSPYRASRGATQRLCNLALNGRGHEESSTAIESNSRSAAERSGSTQQHSEQSAAQFSTTMATPPQWHVLDGLAPASFASRPHVYEADKLMVEDVEDFFDDGSLPEHHNKQGSFLNCTAPSSLSVTKRQLQGQAVPPDAVRQIKALLWGAQGIPPPSWKQGFFFNTKRGLEFGLLQKQGGPCGVLAGVQAHVLAALRTPSGAFTLSPAEIQQHEALITAITTSLWQARKGSTAKLVFPSTEHGMSYSSLGYDQLGRAISMVTASSQDMLQEAVRHNLRAYMREDGWGIILFLLSLVLTRGVSDVQSDMDEPSNSLMGAHGYCTQELVNLILTGSAVSNVFDGDRDLEGSILHGITRRCKLGLLTLFEWYKYVEVGSNLKNPEIPIWVVCSESHFTTLFAADSRPLTGMLPFDLYFYDELSGQDTIIKLSIKNDPAGGWTTRVGSDFADRGKCEGQNIPPLECVVETRWPGVTVSWNGTDPIL